ncbi:hypothetical protein [Pseudalkalibacillus caeni]|uniref:hypothetical protein n=1 Tax=Exobacillus caeni TaxID=2574798 RepID=UPI00148538B3|nr:hypothetical protein [Pseudalkalibacillus caeni]
MMSLLEFKIYYWVLFLWGGAGMLFIAIVSIKEIFTQVNSAKGQKRHLDKSFKETI